MKTQLRYLAILLAAALLLSGCTFPQFPGTGVGQTPAATAEPGAPTSTADAAPAENTATAVTADAEPDKCAAPAADLSFPQVSYQALPETIQDFLGQGGTLQQLDQGLYDLGFLGQPQGIAAGDFDGNAQLDLAVVVINPASSAVTPDGRLLFYLCLQGEYQQFEAETPEEMDVATPIIKYVQDMNQDGAEEVVASFASCGAHTCLESFGIFGWEAERMANWLPGSSEPIPSPQASLEGPDADGYLALKVVSGGIGSVGAGPQRSQTFVYTFAPREGVWTFFGDQAGQSDYRIHALHDADDLAAQENYSEALVLYQQVISSTALQDWQDPETERAYLSAYAHLKMAEIYTLLDRTELAQATVADFEQAAFEGSVGEAYLGVLREFQGQWDGENLAETCAAVQAYVASRSEQLVAPLGPQQFGYANREFQPGDFCPWR